MASFFTLLVGVVFKLDHFIEVVGGVFLLDVFLDETFHFYFRDAERVVGVEVGLAGLVVGDGGVFRSGSSVKSVGCDQVGLLGHPQLLNVFRPLLVLQHYFIRTFFLIKIILLLHFSIFSNAFFTSSY